MDTSAQNQRHLTKKIKTEIKQLEENITELRNYKKRKKKTKTRDLQGIVFGTQENYNKALFIPQEPKAISVHYLVANNLLATWSSMDSAFCGRHKESIEHIFRNCDSLRNTRIMVNNMLKGLHSQFTKTRILNVENTNNKAEAIVITKYKEVLWNIRHTQLGKKNFDEEKAKKKVDDAIYKHF